MSMSMPHEKGLDLQDLLARIKQHCLANDTGTLFLLTENNATIKLVIVEGEIIALSYQAIRGEEAIIPISQLRHCKARYYTGVKLLPANQHLPNTETILDLLQEQSKLSPDAAETTKIVAEKPNQADKTEAVNSSFATVLTILIDETTEYLGPFATVLCRKYMERTSHPPTVSQIHTVLRQLAADIGDETKSMQLEQKVLQRIE